MSAAVTEPDMIKHKQMKVDCKHSLVLLKPYSDIMEHLKVLNQSIHSKFTKSTKCKFIYYCDINNKDYFRVKPL